MAASVQPHSLPILRQPEEGSKAQGPTLEGNRQDTRIQDVWMDNFFSVLEEISLLVGKFNYVSMVSVAQPILSSSALHMSSLSGLTIPCEDQLIS